MRALVSFLTALLLAGIPAERLVAGDHAGKPSFSNPTDYFRSAASGDWSTVGTWESSPDNASWTAATLAPTSAANTIYIRNGHTVTVSSNHDMDQVIIENGGILIHSANTLTVNDGAGDDIIIQSGGIFTLASNSNGPQFTGSATVNINTGGMLRLSASGLTNAGAGVHASNYIYQNASVLEYTLNLAFSSSGVTFFPNVDAVTIPVFRTTGNLGLIGGISPTVINGVYEANGSITFSNPGTKTFRNGIIGTGNIGNDGTSGKFILNGATAKLGGTGTLTVPAGGMDIGSNTAVTMVSNKSVTGNIALLTNALVTLGVYDLSLTGDISGGSVSSHIVTNGTGKLVLNNIAGATARIFPIGANNTSINPLAVFNGSGLNYGARVETGINPSIRYPIAAVNRTWVMNPSGNPAAAVNVNFFYSAGDGNAFFNYTTPVEQGFYTGVWNVINTGLVQAGSYQVATAVSSFAANSDAPMVLGNIPAILETGNHAELKAFKQTNRIVLNWAVSDSSQIDRCQVERSSDGRNYNSIAERYVMNYTDPQPMPGRNYYRIKLIARNGATGFSNMVVVLNAEKGPDLISVMPDPVTRAGSRINISAVQRTNGELIISDLQGRICNRQSVSLVPGYNQVPVATAELVPGLYQVYVVVAGERAGLLRFVVQ